MFHFDSEGFARDLSHYDVSIPIKVSHDGQFVSHAVHHVRPAATLKSSHRRKRNINGDDVIDNVDDDVLHYKLRVNGTELMLELTPNDKLPAPGFVVEHRPRGFRGVQHANISAHTHNRCHFQGHVRGHPGSRVALATCDGLVSLLLENIRLRSALLIVVHVLKPPVSVHYSVT